MLKDEEERCRKRFPPPGFTEINSGRWTFNEAVLWTIELRKEVAAVVHREEILPVRSTL